MANYICYYKILWFVNSKSFMALQYLVHSNLIDHSASPKKQSIILKPGTLN